MATYTIINDNETYPVTDVEMQWTGTNFTTGVSASDAESIFTSSEYFTPRVIAIENFIWVFLLLNKIYTIRRDYLHFLVGDLDLSGETIVSAYIKFYVRFVEDSSNNTVTMKAFQGTWDDEAVLTLSDYGNFNSTELGQLTCPPIDYQNLYFNQDGIDYIQSVITAGQANGYAKFVIRHSLDTDNPSLPGGDFDSYMRFVSSHYTQEPTPTAVWPALVIETEAAPTLWTPKVMVIS